jgi:hypothetical protein
MKLSEVLAALSSNKISITIMDENDNALITFDAAGYGAVESDLGDRKVGIIKINTATAVTISIKAAENSTNDPGTDPSDPGGDP